MFHVGYVPNTAYIVVSPRLVEDWRLFRVSDQRFIKWVGKTCRIFDLGLHLNWAMPTSLPESIVQIQHCINSPLSRKLHFLPFKYCKPHKYANKWRAFSLPLKITQVNIWGVFNTTKVGNACFVIAESNKMFHVNNWYG